MTQLKGCQRAATYPTSPKDRKHKPTKSDTTGLENPHGREIREYNHARAHNSANAIHRRHRSEGQRSILSLADSSHMAILCHRGSTTSSPPSVAGSPAPAPRDSLHHMANHSTIAIQQPPEFHTVSDHNNQQYTLASNVSNWPVYDAYERTSAWMMMHVVNFIQQRRYSYTQSEENSMPYPHPSGNMEPREVPPRPAHTNDALFNHISETSSSCESDFSDLVYRSTLRSDRHISSDYECE